MLLMEVICHVSSLIPIFPRHRNWRIGKCNTLENRVYYLFWSIEFNYLSIIPTGFWSILNIQKCHPIIGSMDKEQWQLLCHSSEAKHHESWIQGRIQHSILKELCYMFSKFYVRFLQYFRFRCSVSQTYALYLVSTFLVLAFILRSIYSWGDFRWNIKINKTFA